MLRRSAAELVDQGILPRKSTVITYG